MSTTLETWFLIIIEKIHEQSPPWFRISFGKLHPRLREIWAMFCKLMVGRDFLHIVLLSEHKCQISFVSNLQLNKVFSNKNPNHVSLVTVLLQLFQISWMKSYIEYDATCPYQIQWAFTSTVEIFYTKTEYTISTLFPFPPLAIRLLCHQ